MLSCCLLWLLAAVANAEPFGHVLRDHFMMGNGVTNLNNGAFGTGARIAYDQYQVCSSAVSRCIVNTAQKYNVEMEANCNHWFRGGYQPLLLKARERLAKYVNVDVDDLVIVENASSGANSVLKSLADNFPLVPGLYHPFLTNSSRAGDKVLYLSVVYPMVRNVMGYIAKEKKLTEIEVKIPFPLSDPEQVLQPLRNAIAANPGIKVASLDHISSYPAALLPIKDMVTLCKVQI